MSDAVSERTLAIFAGPKNKKLIEQLRAGRSRLLEFPFIEAEPIETAGRAPDDLSEFDWLIFPDVHAVEFFLQKLEEKRIDFFALDDLRVCAFGEAVSDRLRFVQLHADIIPARVDTDSVFSALRDYLFDEKEFEDLRILLPRENSARLELTQLLRQRKSIVTELPIYRLHKAGDSGLAKLKALLRGGAVDEFVFTSPAEISDLQNVLDEELANLLAGMSVSAVDEITFQTLHEYGLRPLYFKQK
jgi:uroporphyrinogen-III synthase